MAHPGVWASVGLACGLVRQQVSKPAWPTQLATHYATVSRTAASCVPSSTTCPNLHGLGISSACRAAVLAQQVALVPVRHV